MCIKRSVCTRQNKANISEGWVRIYVLCVVHMVRLMSNISTLVLQLINSCLANDEI
jgi:hypothetical protein